MRIGFIGAGKVGFTFGRYIAEKRELVREKMDGALCLEVGGYFSASRQSAELAAEFTETCVYDSLEQLCEYSEIIFLTVPDGQIGEVWKSIKDLDIRGRIICHASGAMTSDIFSGITEAGAFGYSIHPMYAISSKYESYKELDNSFFTVEGDDRYVDKVCSVIRALGNSCVRIDGTDKVKYHGAAVFASNLVTGLLAVSQELLTQCGFSAEEAQRAIVPLFLGNAKAAADRGPVDSLTGPVERCDTETVRKHLNALSGDERSAYAAVSRCLVPVAERKHPDRDYSGLIRLLNGIGEFNYEEHDGNTQADEGNGQEDIHDHSV